MAGPGIRAIRIVKGDMVLHVHGAGEGREGVWLSKGQVHGLYDAPVKTTYISGAFQEGSSHRFTKKMHRDLELGFLVRDVATSFEYNDSVLRRMFDYEIDRWDPNYTPTTIEVDTMMSGLRKLDVFMYEDPEFVPELDPMMDQFGNIIFKLRAPEPMWYEDAIVDSFGTSSGSGSGFVTVENPTDNIMYQTWVMTEAHWTIPDFQWLGAVGERAPGGADASRLISGINVTSGNGGITVELDRTKLMYRDANDTNALAQFGSTKIFNYPIPPYTPSTELPVSYSSAPAGGAMVQLRMLRRWSRPWGLEIPATSGTVTGTPLESVVNTIGDYSYTIPAFADTVDVVLLGGGGGGNGGQLFPDQGGASGDWVVVTLVRGVNIPWDSDIITGVIGQGGRRGNVRFDQTAEDGAATTATASGMTPLSAAGGVGAAAAGQMGQGAGTFTFNDRHYDGGDDCWVRAQDGTVPGGGGSTGQPLGFGGNGARGQAWFYAYQSGS